MRKVGPGAVADLENLLEDPDGAAREAALPALENLVAEGGRTSLAAARSVARYGDRCAPVADLSEVFNRLAERARKIYPERPRQRRALQQHLLSMPSPRGTATSSKAHWRKRSRRRPRTPSFRRYCSSGGRERCRVAPGPPGATSGLGGLSLGLCARSIRVDRRRWRPFETEGEHRAFGEVLSRLDLVAASRPESAPLRETRRPDYHVRRDRRARSMTASDRSSLARITTSYLGKVKDGRFVEAVEDALAKEPPDDELIQKACSETAQRLFQEQGDHRSAAKLMLAFLPHRSYFNGVVLGLMVSELGACAHRLWQDAQQETTDYGNQIRTMARLDVSEEWLGLPLVGMTEALALLPDAVAENHRARDFYLTYQFTLRRVRLLRDLGFWREARGLLGKLEELVEGILSEVLEMPSEQLEWFKSQEGTVVRALVQEDRSCSAVESFIDLVPDNLYPVIRALSEKHMLSKGVDVSVATGADIATS